MALRKSSIVIQRPTKLAATQNVQSPKAIATKTRLHSKPPSKIGTTNYNLALQRRRLSVVTENKFVEKTNPIPYLHGIEAVEDESSAVVAYAGLSKKGYAPYNPRKKNQDAMIVEQDAETKSVLLCVFDGHGDAGDVISSTIQNRLAPLLMKHPKFAATGELIVDAEGIKIAISESLRVVEDGMLRDRTIATDFSGTTAVVVVIRENLVVVANIGDSRITRGFVGTAADGTQAMECARLSIDHKPDAVGEKERILASGGRVFAVEYEDDIAGPPRVWLSHMDVPGLAMSRSLGDAVAHTAGVVSEPEFFSRLLDERDCCLVIGTDGLWEFLSDEEVIALAMAEEDPKVAVEVLVMEANRRWMKEEEVIDDTTVIVAYVNIAKMTTPPTFVTEGLNGGIPSSTPVSANTPTSTSETTLNVDDAVVTVNANIAAMETPATSTATATLCESEAVHRHTPAGG